MYWEVIATIFILSTLSLALSFTKDEKHEKLRRIIWELQIVIIGGALVFFGMQLYEFNQLLKKEHIDKIVENCALTKEILENSLFRQDLRDYYVNETARRLGFICKRSFPGYQCYEARVPLISTVLNSSAPR